MIKHPAPLGEYAPSDWHTLVLDATGLETQSAAAYAATEKSFDYVSARLKQLSLLRNTLAPRAQEGVTGAITELNTIANQLVDTLQLLATRSAVLALASSTRHDASLFTLATLHEAAIQADAICLLISESLPQSFEDIKSAAENNFDLLMEDTALAF